MSDTKWLLSKSDSITNLLEGSSKFKADLNPEWYDENTIEDYSIIREEFGLEFDSINPSSFQTGSKFIENIIEKLLNIFAIDEDVRAGKAARTIQLLARRRNK